MDGAFRGFADLATWIADHLHVESAVLDGEIACVDDAGLPVFHELGAVGELERNLIRELIAWV